MVFSGQDLALMAKALKFYLANGAIDWEDRDEVEPLLRDILHYLKSLDRRNADAKHGATYQETYREGTGGGVVDAGGQG